MTKIFVAIVHFAGDDLECLGTYAGRTEEACQQQIVDEANEMRREDGLPEYVDYAEWARDVEIGFDVYVRFDSFEIP